MKLIKVLEGLKGKEVSIGAKNGSSYMFIGEVNDESINVIEELFNAYLRSERKKLTVDTGHIINVMNDLKKVSLKDYDKLVSITDDLARTSKSAKKHRDYIDSYVSVLDREVIETFVKETDNTTAIMIVGTENGKCWYKNEKGEII